MLILYLSSLLIVSVKNDCCTLTEQKGEQGHSGEQRTVCTRSTETTANTGHEKTKKKNNLRTQNDYQKKIQI